MTTDNAPAREAGRQAAAEQQFTARWFRLPTLSTPADRWSVVLLSVVLLVGLVLRFYRLASQRLWVDELYTAELVREGLGTIWHNAFVDHNLPLQMAFFWLAAQMGGLTELSLRLVSALAALAALALYYRYSTRAVDRWTALLATGLLAIAPLAVYYAQEARPYALPLFGQMLALLAFEHLRRGTGNAGWLLYMATAVFAVQLHYINLIPIGAQLLTLLILRRDRRIVLLWGALVILAMGVSLAPFLSGASAELANWRNFTGMITPYPALQTMVAGDMRIASGLARRAGLAVVVIGFALGLLDRRALPALLIHVIQVTLALLSIFVLFPAAGMFIPNFDDRQFLMLLPSVLFVFSIGIRWLGTHTYGWLPAGALCLVLSATSALGLASYFGDFVKSPEGLAADEIGARARPGDIAISDGAAYSVDAAMRFYYPNVTLYSFRGKQNGRFMFLSNGSLLLGRWMSGDRAWLDDLTTHRRVWLITREGSPRPFIKQLLAHYYTGEEYVIGPFHAQMLSAKQ